MKIKHPKKKNKKIKKINKKNIWFVLLYLKTLKIFKVIFHIFILLFVIYIIFILCKNNIISNLTKTLSLKYSNLIYNNICINVEIKGVERSNIIKIQEKIYNYCSLENKNNLKYLLKDLYDDPWIKNISIKRKLPDSLEINIEEYLPFAIWNSGNNRMHLIDENGEIIKINENEKKGYYNLLIVAGEGAKENIYSLFNLLSSNPNLFSRVKSALRVSNRRWNLELDNGIIIQMPETDLLDAWNKLDKILSIRGSEIDLRKIDFRNKDKIYLEQK